MTDEPHLHESSAYTDDEWEKWKDYADVVTIQVRFKSWAGAEDNAETWFVQSDGSAWSKDWLTRQLIELAAVDAANSCCGRGNYMLDAADRKTEWGASGAAFDAVLTLSENLLSEATWVALGAIAQNLRARLRAKDGWPDGDPITDEQARESALSTVARYRNIDRELLAVTSVEFADKDTVLVELRHLAGGGRFTVELRGHNGSVRMARVRKISEQDNP